MNRLRSIGSILFLFCGLTTSAQIILFEDFEGPMDSLTGIPVSWIESGLSTDGIYYVGDAAQANTGGYWPVPTHTLFAQSNDDLCSCDKSEDRLILPVQDFRYVESSITLIADLYQDGNYGNQGSVEVSIDQMQTWSTVYTIPPLNGIWQDSTVINLDAFLGEDSVYIAFRLDDNATWTTGLGVDNVQLDLYRRFADAQINHCSPCDYNYMPGFFATNQPMKVEVENLGTDTVDNVQISYLIQGVSAGIVFSQIDSFPQLFPDSIIFIDHGTIDLSNVDAYTLSIQVLSDNDTILSNNQVVHQLIVDTTTYARDNGVVIGPFNPLQTTSYSIGNVYDISAPNTSVDSVLVQLMNVSVGDSAKVVIYSMSNGIPNSQIGQSNVFIASSGQTGDLLYYFNMADLSGNPLVIPQGKIWVAVEDVNPSSIQVGLADKTFQLGGTLVFDGQNYVDVATLGFENPAIIRPYFSQACPGPIVSASIDSIACAGQLGSITVTVTDTLGVSYAWNTGDTSAQLLGLSGGSYTITVTNQQGCPSSLNIFLYEPPSLTISLIDNGDSTATAFVNGGTPPYTYQWDANAGNQTTLLAQSLSAGWYTISVSDQNGCLIIDSVQVATVSIRKIPTDFSYYRDGDQWVFASKRFRSSRFHAHVYDLMGREIPTKMEYSAQQIRIHVMNTLTGVFIVRLRSDEEEYLFKILN